MVDFVFQKPTVRYTQIQLPATIIYVNRQSARAPWIVSLNTTNVDHTLLAPHVLFGDRAQDFINLADMLLMKGLVWLHAAFWMRRKLYKNVLGSKAEAWCGALEIDLSIPALSNYCTH